MDEMKKWTLYLTFLVAGFATGIGTIGLFPQFWLEYGITGLVIHLGFLALFTYVAIIEAERVMKSGYYFVELYKKILRKPAMITVILVLIAIFLSYYAANTMLILLAPVVGTGALGRLIAKIIMLAIVFVILTRAKEKTFSIMAIGSMILVIAVVITTIAFWTRIPPTAAFLGMAKHMAMSRQHVSLAMIKLAAERALYGVGLGFAFYLMLGSFMNERFNHKLIIGTGVFIQFIIGVLSTITIIYAIAPATPAELLKYVYGGEEGAIQLMGELPKILAHYPGLLLLIVLSIFFAGVTSILPTAEVGLQILESSMGVNRNKAAMYLIAISLAIGIPDSVPSLAEALLKAVSISIFFTALYELYPVVSKEVSKVTGIRPTTAKIVASALTAAFLIPSGLYAIYSNFKAGDLYVLSALLAVILVLFGFFGNSLFVRKAPE
ncbi:sodium-dependent transporter [Thermococcus sp.]|uniref:sodium-dependent transporter n=1 Tax=Thermococcus sp. TaxID=35749 RepID=UPI00260A09FC|nr:sodium-dependent transporter [Thermococcus sp.]